MLKIGKHREASRDELVELLLDCHEKIRSFTALAGRLAAGHHPSPAEVVEAATAVRRYFADALPLHARDEEDSIEPRLRGAAGAELDRELDAMHAEHASHVALLGRLIELCDALATDPSRHRTLAPQLREVASTLAAEFETHLGREERVVFPALARLPEADRAAIVREVRARRRPAEAWRKVDEPGRGR